MYCPECKSKLIENVVREYCSPYSDKVREEYGLWCDDCKEDMSSQMIYNNKEKEVKCENI